MFNFFFLENKERNIQGCIFMLIHHYRSKLRPFKLALLKHGMTLGVLFNLWILNIKSDAIQKKRQIKLVIGQEIENQ